MLLEALFNGDIYASENVVPKSEQFKETSAHISETMTYFEGKLSRRIMPCLKSSATVAQTRAT